MNIFTVFAQNNFVANLVMAILFLASLFSWYLIFYKTYQLYFNFTILTSINHQNSWFDFIQNKKYQSLSQKSVAFSLFSMVPNLEQNNHLGLAIDLQKEFIITQLVQKLDNIRYDLDKGLTLLGSIGSGATFIGLFGTVLGIYHGFEKISTSGNASISVVAGPIAESLITTAIGLAVAIPAMLAYNGIVRYNNLLIQNLRHLSENICFALLSQKNVKVL
jgi:biopolymer transport protein ExbB